MLYRYATTALLLLILNIFLFLVLFLNIFQFILLVVFVSAGNVEEDDAFFFFFQFFSRPLLGLLLMIHTINPSVETSGS